ncbi:carbohydrate sulfotransferase 5-like [Rana temporaria]|uniref:carbohydrate sulfotransferase 5-like n=1 Tax=Rana temporaria TaxID=8407 RepID=UPI001AADB205|nr:carbohydrate sulfotransferase 5-like [Rana temporaria]
MSKFSTMFYVVAAVITLQTILMVLTNVGTPLSDSTPREKPRKVHLLIISTWRAGSSVVGQFFNQHPDVFYLKEPAWHVWNAMPHNNAHVLHMAVRDLIRSIFTCDMSVLDVYIQNRSYVSNLFQWSSSRALCLPPACNTFSRKKIVTEANCQKYCAKSPFNKVEESCNAYSHIVLQEFRIFDLKVLYPLLKDPTLNVKILHVVRDPRALAKSRRQLKFALELDNAIILNLNDRTVDDTGREKVLREICRSQVDMYRTINDRPPPFLKDHYMLLRYDDLVRDTTRIAKQLYTFAGINPTDESMTWIYKMTHGENLENPKPFIITPRDALHMSLKWKEELTLQEIISVQKICKDFMEFFRYQNIDSEDELNDLDLETVLPIHKDVFNWHNDDENE